MNDTRDSFPITDAELDSALSSLTRLKPGEGFGDRVMARVRIPERRGVEAPSPAVSVRRRRRRWTLAGFYAAASAAWTAFLGGLALNGQLQLETALGLVEAVPEQMERITADMVSTFSPALVDLAISHEAWLPGLSAALSGLWLVSAVSGIGLYWIMRSYRGESELAHATR